MAQTDDDLLTGFATGEAEAFVAFYHRHLQAVLAYFLRRTGDPELTADLTAETFAAALTAAERYRPGERPALAWLYGIASHKLSDSRRRGQVRAVSRRRLGLGPLGIDDEDLARVVEMAGADAASRALDELPATQRDAVLARVVDERPYAEIAA
ncbi:MAG: RNA polymerase sigma factor, partial [Solirubrobacteraceae bacterium]